MVSCQGGSASELVNIGWENLGGGLYNNNTHNACALRNDQELMKATSEKIELLL